MANIVKHLYRVASSAIREKVKSKTRSPKWDSVRDAFLREAKECAACGSKKRLQVHHKKPFHLHPELELVKSNLIVLCMDKHDCHCTIGHGDSWKAYNSTVDLDAATVRKYPARRKMIEAAAKKARLKD